jgi:SAM-dependent methyltransferase
VLPFEKESFDLIWAEGSIYIVGLEMGLRQWRPLLRKRGAIAFTEVSWLEPNIPEELNRFWMDAYPAIASIAHTMKRIERAGYGLLDHFILPESDWWNDYYNPIEEKLPGLRDKYKDDAEALQVLLIEEKEIDLYRRFSSYYGYVFYIATKANE